MSKARKRFREHLHHDDYWMGMAFMLAAGSSSFRQQGCVIVGTNNEVAGVGHDGSPKTMQDSEHPLHAEMNALFNCTLPLAGGTAYVTYTPCYHCVLSLVAANIKRIVYFKTKPLDQDTEEAMRCAYGQIDEFRGNLNWMRDYLKTLNIF